MKISENTSLHFDELKLPVQNNNVVLKGVDLPIYYQTQLYSFCLGFNNTEYLIRLTDDKDYIRPTIQTVQNGKLSPAAPLAGIPKGMLFTNIATGIGSNANLQVILIGKQDGLPYLVWQDYKSGNWHWFGKLPIGNYQGTFNWVAFGNGNSENPQVVLLSNGMPYLIWQAIGNGIWAWYGPLPTGNFNSTFECVQLVNTIINGSESNLQAILVANNGLPYLIWQAVGNGIWAWYGPLPMGNFKGQLQSVQVANGFQGNIQAIFLGIDGLPYSIWQAAGNGIWTWYGKLPTGNYKGNFLYYVLIIKNNCLTVVLFDKDNNKYEIEQQGNGWLWIGKV